MDNIIETENLTKRYGGVPVVRSVSLAVPQGSVYGFIGPNGAGKSTTMKMLLGLVKQSGGSVRLLGREMNAENRLALLRQTGSLIESPSSYGHLTALCAAVRPEEDWQRAVGYSALTVNLSLMNAVVMPLAMAALRGLVQNAVICLAEGAAFLLAGRVWGYTQTLELPRVLWLMLSTFVVNAMRFFALLALSVRSGTQVLPLAVGLACSLLSVFTAFMPERLTLLTPWAYDVPLSAMRMHYDRETRITAYEPLAFPAGLLAAAVVCGVLGYVLARRAVRDQEV